MVSLPVIPVSGMVHHNVHPGPLQQFLLCCPSAGHRHGLQDSPHDSLLCHTQRQTGEEQDAGPLPSSRGHCRVSGWHCVVPHHQSLLLRQPLLFVPLQQSLKPVFIPTSMLFGKSAWDQCDWSSFMSHWWYLRYSSKNPCCLLVQTELIYLHNNQAWQHAVKSNCDLLSDFETVGYRI